MEITRPIDIEEEIRKALAEQGVTIYCKPLPKDFALPCILVTCVGMTSRYNWANQATGDGFDVTLDARAEDDATAVDYLRTALGILEAVTAQQNQAFCRVVVNTFSSSINDPVRPDLKLCTARLRVSAHRETITT
ncbi:MAG: hypothetical protein IKF99_08395 [Oscillospiraceae bacterium]|nr:hypothetical protein [Oscillospiraceae bacterium]MBR3238439.1 hypothetical protein [Oscillospiraceae bacterium]